MKKEEINEYLKKWRISPSFINWKDNIIPPTKIWYSIEKNAMVSDCGVELPFEYCEPFQIYEIVFDMQDAITQHYNKMGISLEKEG